MGKNCTKRARHCLKHQRIYQHWNLARCVRAGLSFLFKRKDHSAVYTLHRNFTIYPLLQNHCNIQKHRHKMDATNIEKYCLKKMRDGTT